jgi:hypothetical protein
MEHRYWLFHFISLFWWIIIMENCFNYCYFNLVVLQ